MNPVLKLGVVVFFSVGIMLSIKISYAEQNVLSMPIQFEPNLQSTTVKDEQTGEEMELIADVSEIFTKGKMTAIQVMHAELLSSSPGAVKVKIINGVLAGTTTECQLSSTTKGMPYGYKDGGAELEAAIFGGPKKESKDVVDQKIARHVGKEVKVGVNRDECSYFMLVQ